MAVLRVNPTRMELNRLKKRLATAVKGHKLLKDKRDEMLRQFMLYARKNIKLRRKLEAQVSGIMLKTVLGRALMSPEAAMQALSRPAVKAQLKTGQQNVMSVRVPVLELETQSSSRLPYGMYATSGELDEAVMLLSGIMPQLIKLAETEKTTAMLADEIEKTRRRVNALEYVMIPQLQETIRFITMKLEENERGGLIRLMKVKTMLEQS